MPPPTKISREKYLPGRLQNSHQNGGRTFLIFVADPRTVRSYMNRCQTSVMTILHLAVLELGKGSPHGGIARESGVDDRSGHTSKRRDGSPAAGNGDGGSPAFQAVGDRGGRSLWLDSFEYEFGHRREQGGYVWISVHALTDHVGLDE